MHVKRISFLLIIIIIIELVSVPVVKATNRVLVIGIDGGTFDLILPWIEEGELPTLGKMINEGTYGNLSSMLPYISPVMWTSFYTGKNPGKHGVFEFLKRSPDSYEIIPVTSRDVESKAVWDIVNDDGKKVILMNIPMTYPPQKVNGIMVTGFLSPDESVFTYPESLTQYLKDRDYQIESMQRRFAPGDEDYLLNNLNYTLEKRSEIAIEFMNENEWDLFIVVFTGSDRVQHYFWRYMESGDERYGDAILEYYQKLDKKIGEMLESIDENTSVVIMSDHGFGPLKGEVYINWWLSENGLLKYESSLTYWTIRLGLTQQNIVTFLKKVKIFKFVEWFTNKLGVDFKKSVPYPTYDSVDFSKTKAYAAQFGGGIYLNVKNREPNGIIEQEEYEDIRNWVIKDLEDLKNPKTGEKLFKKIFKREELYDGAYVKYAPDIIIDGGDYDPVGWFGYNKIYDTSPIKSGSHRENGILIIWGSNTKGNNIEEAKIIDITPTILDLMNIAVPKDIDGKSLI